MSERALKRLLAAAPADREAEERAWEVVRSSYAERQPAPRPACLRPALVLAALAVAVAAAALSPPGRAVVNAVRRTIGIQHAAPALFRLPAPGRLLVSGRGGTWVVAADGSKRRLGDYADAAWSPHFGLPQPSRDVHDRLPGAARIWRRGRGAPGADALSGWSQRSGIQDR